MSRKDTQPVEDDGRVIADMSGIERMPLLIPRLDRLSSQKKKRPEGGLEQAVDNPEPEQKLPPVELDAEGRRAMMGGAVAAGLLVVGVLAVAFAALILLIGVIGR
ncbi:MAG: hypothetical protein IKT15_03005 [Firmicutes bacterium]|nr:hypothetical protein [Bacillota bacterium]